MEKCFRKCRLSIETPGLSKKKSLEEARIRLQTVGLSDWALRFPSELSGGMQQRVGIARALSTQASILLLDEPFSALDPLHRRNLQDELLNIQKNLKKTLIFVTHDFNEAIRLADRVAIMDSGRILQLGSPNEIIQMPSCERVSRFVSQTHPPEIKHNRSKEFHLGNESSR